MGYGTSIWQMNPKQSRLPPGAKECKLCMEVAADGEELCVEHQKSGHTPPQPKPEAPKKKKRKRKKKKVVVVVEQGPIFTQAELDWFDKVILEAKERREKQEAADQSDDSSD